MRPFTDHSFEQYLAEQRLMGCRCGGCGRLAVPPRAICAGCGGAEMSWEAVAQTGTLAAFTSIAIGPPHMAEEGHDRDHPYCCGVIELAESTRVVARIEGFEGREPSSIQVGTAMQASFLRRPNGRTILAFRPADGA